MTIVEAFNIHRDVLKSIMSELVDYVRSEREVNIAPSPPHMLFHTRSAKAVGREAT